MKMMHYLLFMTVSVLYTGCSLPEEGRIREPVDTVGYTHSAEGIAAVAAHAEALEAAKLEKNRVEMNLDRPPPFAAAISPHDDYAYAQQVYVHLYPYLKARHLILIGVAHKARDFPDCEGKLVFETFHAWRGPCGEVKISPLREELVAALPEEDLYVSNALHGKEHSLEGLVPFLQHYNREASIVPILVPYMSWERLEELACKTAGELARIVREKGLSLGRDVAILISSDSVHYGDCGWGGKSYADYGVDGAGYDLAVARDLSLAEDYLSGEITSAKAEEFYRSVVADDFHDYRITWCGRFSIPFGLVTLTRLASLLGLGAPQGDLLRYGTTLDPGRSDPGVPGLGVTAPANLHHWVGFISVGYRLKP